MPKLVVAMQKKVCYSNHVMEATTSAEIPKPHPRTAAVEQFVKNYFSLPPGEKHPYASGEVDISDPQQKDVQQVNTGKFEVSKLLERPDEQHPEQKRYDFYVGGTEFHLTGSAAADIDRIDEELKHEAQGKK